MAFCRQNLGERPPSRFCLSEWQSQSSPILRPILAPTQRALRFPPQKVFVNQDGFLRLGLESIKLPAPSPNAQRDAPTWYTHGEISEGYTEPTKVTVKDVQQEIYNDIFEKKQRLAESLRTSLRIRSHNRVEQYLRKLVRLARAA